MGILKGVGKFVGGAAGVAAGAALNVVTFTAGAISDACGNHDFASEVRKFGVDAFEPMVKGGSYVGGGIGTGAEYVIQGTTTAVGAVSREVAKGFGADEKTAQIIETVARVGTGAAIGLAAGGVLGGAAIGVAGAGHGLVGAPLTSHGLATIGGGALASGGGGMAAGSAILTGASAATAGAGALTAKDKLKFK